MKNKKIILLVLNLMILFLFNISTVSASTNDYKMINFYSSNGLTPTNKGEEYYVYFDKGEYDYNVVYINGEYVYGGSFGSRVVAMRIFLNQVHYATAGDYYVELQRNDGSFDYIEYTLIPNDGTGESPDGGHEADVDYYLDNINNNLGQIKTIILKNHGESYTELQKIANYTNVTAYRLQATNEKLDTMITQFNKLNADLNSNFQKTLAKQDIANTHLGKIVDNTKNIADNLNTSKQPAKQQAPDFSKELDKNRPNQNENSFSDNNTYFKEGNHNEINDSMPSPNQEPKQWEGVEKPIEQIKDSELNRDSENKPDDEYNQDSEFSKDNELTQDQFENTENYEKSNELTREEFIKDNEFTSEKELVKDEFTADGELSRDDYTSDKELSKDVMNGDEELKKDEFYQTENYDNTNYFQQTEIYENNSKNYGLRWKSVKGKFQ